MRSLVRPITQNSTANRWNTATRAVESSTRQCLGIRRQAYSSKQTRAGQEQQLQQQAAEEAEQPKGPTQDTLPDVSNEAAAMDRILSGKKCDGNAAGSPELEQGTPIDEVGYCLSSKMSSGIVR